MFFLKKFVASILSAIMVLCSITTAFAYQTKSSDIGKTGGSMVVQGASGKSLLAETVDEKSELPQSYSSVDAGFVTPVKDQGQQNTCVFFSGMAAMETALLKNGFGEYDLSEEHANYWASLRNDGKGWQRDRVNSGAFSMTGYGYLTSGGTVLESDLPYMSSNKEYFEDLKHIEPLFYAGGVRVMDSENIDAEYFKRTIMECGGISASFAVVFDYINSDTSAYYCGEDLDVDTLSVSGHQVFVVGWDDNYSKNNFNPSHRPKSDGAWLVKNSWGDILSYIWISYEDKYFASGAFSEGFAINDVIKNHSCNQLLQVDEFGPTYNMAFDESSVDNPSEITFINTFDFSAEMSSISNVEFSTSNAGDNYIIYYIPTTNGVPTNDESQWTEIASGQVEYAGNQNIAVNNYIVPDESGAIGVKITCNDKEPVTIGCCEWVSDLNSQQMIFLPRTLDNRSFVKSGNTSFSLTDYYNSIDDEIGGNFTIKLIANVIEGDVDKNGVVNIMDATLVQKAAADIEKLDDDTVTYVADVNADGQVNVLDATKIQKIAVGLPD